MSICFEERKKRANNHVQITRLSNVLILIKRKRNAPEPLLNISQANSEQNKYLTNYMQELMLGFDYEYYVIISVIEPFKIRTLSLTNHCILFIQAIY